ncbi:hypothetical protein [Sphingomonas sp. 3-13AW]|uniref:hypothetical protein n=1 Tax=Sphingomonas sp. 3-13AW TaxID=3050450 RepID=UPI003BB7C4AC
MRQSSSIAAARSEHRAMYRLSEINHCPGCGQSQWFVGRMSAECAFCHTALPISGIHAIGNVVTRTSPRPPLLAA